MFGHRRHSMFSPFTPPVRPETEKARDTISTHADHDAHGYEAAPTDLNATGKRSSYPTASEVKQALGFHPDDPNVEVTFLPMGGYRGGNEMDRAFDALWRDIFGDVQNAPDADARMGDTPAPPTTPYPEPKAETGEERAARLMLAIDGVLAEARNMLVASITKHAPMHSPHEGHSVIREELDELWDEVKLDGGGRDRNARKEALQVAAMGMRYVLDIDPR